MIRLLKLAPAIVIGVVLLCMILKVAHIANPFMRAVGDPEFMMINDTVSHAFTDNISEDLPYREYRKKEDSLKWLANIRSGKGAGFIIGGLGITYYRDCNTCVDLEGVQQAKAKYYLKFANWKQREINEAGHSTYLMKNGNYYAKRPVIDRVERYPEGNIKRGHYEIMPIPYKFDNEDKHILLEVSRTMWVFLKYLIIGVGLAALVASIVAFHRFVLFLIDVSGGDIFTIKNYRRLRFILIVTSTLFLSGLVVDSLLPVFFRSYYDPALMEWSVSWNTKFVYACSVAFFYVITRAFKKGMRLEEEQTLTI
jgi:hypothetical protein